MEWKNMKSTKMELQDSLTMNAKQRNWNTKTRYPLCPAKIGNEPLRSYLSNLKLGAVLTENEYACHYIDEFLNYQDKELLVRTHTKSSGSLKDYSLVKITYEDGFYVHEGHLFFEERGAKKALVEASGSKWDGEEGIDDYC